MAGPVLQVSGLTMRYETRQGEVKAVDDVSFDLMPGQVLGLVGESGSGKTSIAISLMRLLPDNARIVSGEVLLDGHDLLAMGAEQIREFRWRRISMIFQAARTPWTRCTEWATKSWRPLKRTSRTCSCRPPGKRVTELFELVGLDPQLTQRYPHEYSGGMRQRAVIAMALACQPDVVIADEPTTALDVIVQDRILRRLKEIQRDLQMSMVYITHDIAVVAEVTDRIGVMYAGKLVELGQTGDVFNSQYIPIPRLFCPYFPVSGVRNGNWSLWPGEPPNLIDPPDGCRFHPRCPFATDSCRTEEPPIVERGTHWAACWNPLPVSHGPANSASIEEGQG